MTAAPEYALVELATLREHEEVDGRGVEELAARIRADGVVKDPIWVDRGSRTVLNGHHRLQALGRLGAVRAPVWLFEYVDDPSVVLERWSQGPPIAKREVVERALEGRLFPPKTTRHTVLHRLDHRPTRLADLGVATAEPPDAVAAPADTPP